MLLSTKIVGFLYLLLPFQIQAIDLGEALKNLVKNPELLNVEASTGTLVSKPPETEKKPVGSNSASCDELLAQAVVRSNEQKIAAISERDTALISAANATIIANDCMRKLDEQQLKLNESMEQKKLLEEQSELLLKQIEHIQHETQVSIDKSLEQTQLEIILVRNETQSLVEKIRNDYHVELDRVKAAAAEDIARTNHDAEERVAKLQQETANFISNFTETALKEKITVEEESSQIVDAIQRELDIFKEKSDTALYDCQLKSQENELQLRKDMDAFKEQVERKTRKLQLVWKAKRNRANVIASQMIEKFKEDAEKQVEASRLSAEQEIARISTALTTRLDGAISTASELQVTKESLEKDLIDAQAKNIENSEMIKKSLAQIEVLEVQLVQSRDLNTNLLSQIQSFDILLKEKDSIIQMWESKPKMYVNVTLLMEDLHYYLDKFAALMKGTASEAQDILQSATQRIMIKVPMLKTSFESNVKTYYQVCRLHYRRLLEEYPSWISSLKSFSNRKSIDKAKKHMNEIVNKMTELLRPSLVHANVIYKTHVNPVVESTYKRVKTFYNRRFIPIIRKTRKIVLSYTGLAKKRYLEGRSICIKNVITAADIITRRVELIGKRQENAKVWVIVLDSLQNIRHNASFYVDAIPVFLAFMLFIRCRFFIFRMMLKMLRIIWFLFPLRFVFRPRNSDRVESANHGANGHSMLVVGGVSKK